LSDQRLYEVIVVGAGLAGLSAAHQLALAGKKTLVLEADDRVGGKVYTARLQGVTVEHGAQWITPRYTQSIYLINSLGLQIDRSNTSGQHLYAHNGHQNYFDGLFPEKGLGAKLSVRRLLKRLGYKVIDDPERPWLAHSAPDLDEQRFSQYLRQTAYSSSYFQMLNTIFECRYLNGISQVSALEAITNWHACQMQEKWQIVGGMDQLTRKLALEIDVQLRQPVTAIVRDRAFVRVYTPDKHYRCRRVIVALPPSQASAIRYEPSPGISKTSLWGKAEAGRVIKSTLVFDQPYWRRQNWSGQAFLSDDYALHYLVDAGYQQEMKGILTTYTIGQRCRKLENLSDADRLELLIQQVSTILRLPRDIKVLVSSIYDWKTPPHGSGAYHVFPPKTLTTYGHIMDQPEGPVYWAAAELDRPFRSTIEGAIRSGRRAAERILGIYHNQSEP
jgi:monoamine oxidase